MTELKHTRRKFLKNSMIMTAAAPVIVNHKTTSILSKIKGPVEPIKLAWLEKSKTNLSSGLTWGVPWSRGELQPNQEFHLLNKQKETYKLQSWPLAYWPDGSLKWTGHAATALPANEDYAITPGKTAPADKIITVKDTGSEIEINTQKLQCKVHKSGQVLMSAISLDNQVIASAAVLEAIIQDQPDDNYDNPVHRQTLKGQIENIIIEQNGPLRAVIKITGRHTSTNLTLLPFVIRLIFFAGSDEIKVMHTLIYDANEQIHFVKAIGLSLAVPLNDELHNRHIRFVNAEHDGLFSEAVRGLTGLRRDPGKAFTQAQINGTATPATTALPGKIADQLKYVPSWGDYTLFQGNSEGFTLKKRTAAGHGWISAAQGKRALGTVYLGTP
ncbi:hypothetical protein, partial [Pedobacter sp.]|uniref:exo-rhamnogalacturonan lyase family protein n=1 Tax=Pedobacter sp. TaxID=1411316 RepID=UPI003D7FAB1A